MVQAEWQADVKDLRRFTALGSCLPPDQSEHVEVDDLWLLWVLTHFLG